MPRITWNRLIVLLFALPLGSCIGDETSTCSTCPLDLSARLNIAVSSTGLVDSVHITVDGGPRVTVKRGGRRSFEGLSAGLHQISTVRWFSDQGVAFRRPADRFQIRLERGETRAIVFHNDFPLITALPHPASPDGEPERDGSAAARMG